MDIKHIDNSVKAKILSSDKIKKGSDGFKQIFDRKISEIPATTTTAPMDTRSEVLDHGDKILNLLEDYARKLNDPSKSLKDIEPLVARIQKEASLIERSAAEKAQNDRDLGSIVKDLVVTSNVAALKFYRGDFV